MIFAPSMAQGSAAPFSPSPKAPLGSLLARRSPADGNPTLSCWRLHGATPSWDGWASRGLLWKHLQHGGFFFWLRLIYTFVLLLAPRYERGDARTMIKM